ncbi:hypothetical protein KO317_03240 [Candidatus Micrarchaeota archaeon]|nr:hypothetical protein [Candidatus Micrarchaeota archaeon]
MGKTFIINGRQNSFIGIYREGEAPNSKTLEISFGQRFGTGPINTLHIGSNPTPYKEGQEKKKEKAILETKRKEKEYARIVVGRIKKSYENK